MALTTTDVKTVTRFAYEVGARQVLRDPLCGELRTLVGTENNDGVLVTLRFTDGSTSKIGATTPVDVVVG